MVIRTATWGDVEVSAESFLTLPEGLIGFEDQHEYVLLEREDCRPFRWLVSFQDPGLAFPLLDPAEVIPGYQAPLSMVEQALLELQEGEAPALYLVASVIDEGRQIYANLRAPLVVNRRLRTGRQVVLLDTAYETQHPVLERGGTPAVR
jgi:flagellar assembly factor FliW